MLKIVPIMPKFMFHICLLCSTMPIVPRRIKVICSNKYYTSIISDFYLKAHKTLQTLLPFSTTCAVPLEGLDHWAHAGPRHEDEILHGMGLGLGLRTRLPVYLRHITLKKYLYSWIVLNAFCYLLFPKRCQHNLPNPIIHQAKIFPCES